MKYRTIGRTDIEGSVITFGAMAIGGGERYPDADDAVSLRALQAAFDSGITVVDSAPVYGFGHSEELIGKAIKGRRDEVVVSTKCGLWWGDDEGSYRFTWDGHAVKRNLSPRTIRIEVEESLRRLDTDYIDIYYTHNPAMPPFVTPHEDTVAVLVELRDAGKIRAIGASNCPPEDIEASLAADAIEIVQRKYSLLDRSIEADILPLVERSGLSLHAYSPLGNGILTGKFAAGDAVPAAGSRDIDPYFGELMPQALRLVDGLRGIADDLGTTVAALSIAALLHRSPAVNVIAGIRREDQLADSLAAADLELSADVLGSIDGLLADFDAEVA